jgi:hypothetical protein
MTAIINDIPQIKPEENNKGIIKTNLDSQIQESILVPKLNMNSPKNTLPPKKGKRSFLRLSLIILIVFISLAVLVGLPMFSIYKKAHAFYAEGQKLKLAVSSQDISAIKTEIGNTKKSLADLQGSFKFISWIKIIPYFGSYLKDADHAMNAGKEGLDAFEIAISTTEPYLDILGFGKGSKAEDGMKTSQQRIDFFVKAIPDLIPKVGEISQKTKIVKEELGNIDPERYPQKFGGKDLREPLRKGLELAIEVADYVERSKPLLESSPYLLGLDKPRQYLVLFQNDKELRPTGGFMTAYSIMKVDKAKFEPVISSDIYNLDAKYKPTLPAPDPLIKYIKGPYTLSKNLRLRDMNWSPDFAESMKLFVKEAGTVGINNIDGVIAVDTQLLVNLLNAIGPIGVPGFGNFSTKIEPSCNCPQVIHELESFADVEGPIVWDPAGTGKIIYKPPNSDNRKKIIGPLMNSILANAMGQPKEKLPDLFKASFDSVIQKHVLFYMLDDKAQNAVESFGIAGKIEDVSDDYFYVNDANLGGRKSNLYVKTEVEQVYEIVKDGSIEKTVTITYKNPEKQDGWLNSVLPDWVRIYVPKGSQLIALEGLDEKVDPYEEFDKTVFAGFFKLRPEGVSKVFLKYRLPFKSKTTLPLLIQKQPGLDAPLYSIKVGKFQEEFFLKSDKEIKLHI